MLLASFLVPCVYSRIASQWRFVSVHSATVDRNEAATIHASRIRIASYNIAHGRGLAESNWDGGTQEDRIYRLDRMAALLRKMKADIVVLNEVDFDASWSNCNNQASYLAEKAGYPYWAEQRNLDFRLLVWKWRFGNAVLSKFPISCAKVTHLPGYSTVETFLAGKKRAIICDVRINGRPLRIIGAHLSHRSESVRVNSARMLAEFAAGSDSPVILAGDLNSTPSGFPGSARDHDGENAIDIFDSYRYFQRSPRRAPPASRNFTFHAANPTRIIDWVLIPRDWSFERFAVEPSELSDHRPVFADVTPQTGF